MCRATSSNELFHIPFVCIPPGCADKRSRAVKQRISQKRRAYIQCNDMIKSLNELYEPSCAEEGVRPPTVAQSAVHDRLLKISLQCGPLFDNRSSVPEASLRELLGSKAGGYPCGDATSSGPAVFDLSLLSLPLIAGSCALLETLEGNDFSDLKDLDSRLLLTESELSARQSVEGPRRAYFDQQLIDDRELYLQTVRELHSRGLVKFVKHAKGRVWLFSVWKKPGRQRLIIDCRRVNQRLRKPRKTRLATSAAFGEINLDLDQDLSFASHDVADCFYQYSIPLHFARYFGLMSITASEL